MNKKEMIIINFFNSLRSEIREYNPILTNNQIDEIESLIYNNDDYIILDEYITFDDDEIDYYSIFQGLIKNSTLLKNNYIWFNNYSIKII